MEVGWSHVKTLMVCTCLAGWACQTEVDASSRRKKGKDPDLDLIHERWQGVNEEIGASLAEYVSDHFVVYTDFPDGKGMAKGCEVVFKGLRKVFGLKRREKIWTGRLVMFFFRSRDDFLRFGLEIDKFEGVKVSGGYFKRGGRLGAHIAIPQPSLMAGGEEQMVAVAVHELGHAFLDAYCGAGRAPIWMHEGVAQVCEQIHDPNDRGLARHRARVKQWVQNGLAPRTFKGMLEREYIAGSDHESYAMAYSMVEWMVRMEPKRFRKLLALTKKGTESGDAIEKAFGKSVRKLEPYWAAYVKRKY